MEEFTLSVEAQNSPKYAASCLFEHEVFLRTFGLMNGLINDYVVTISCGDQIVATASYCSGTTNPLLITEAGAPDLFIQQDGTYLPRHLFMEYGGRTLDEKRISRRNIMLVVDVLNSAIFRLAQLQKVALITGIAGPTAPKIFGRIGTHAVCVPVNRLNIERNFPDAWDAFFAAEERSVYSTYTKDQPDALTTLDAALKQLPSLQWGESAKIHLSLT